MDRKEKRVRIAIGLSGAALIILIAYAIVSWIMTIGKANVRVVYAPFAATVLLDGQEYKNNASHYLVPGIYNVEVRFDGFRTVVEEVEVTLETKYLFGSLPVDGEAGEQYMNEHMDEFLAIEGVASIVNNEKGAKERKNLLKEAPVAASLPVKNALFSISYVYNEESGVKIYIASTNAYIDKAVQEFEALLSKNEQLYQYDVTFSGYDDPLAEAFVENDEEDPVEYLRKGFAGVDDLDIVVAGTTGDYFCAKLTTGSEETYTLMTVRTIMRRKDDGGWEMLGDPMPFLTRFNTSGATDEVIELTNGL